MQRIPRDQARKYAFDWRRRPLLRVQPGENFEMETWDASTGYFKLGRRQGDSGAASRLRSQPAAGQPDRRPDLPRRGRARRHARRRHRGDPGRRPFLDRHRPEPRPARRIDALAGTVGRLHDQDLPPHARPQRHDARRHAALQRATLLADHAVHRHARRGPGSRGRRPASTARANGAATSTSATSAPGNRILLPIYHPGALFYLGDVHASQGDTEFTGTAAETKATVRLRLDLHQGQDGCRGCASRSRTSLVAVYAYRPLEVGGGDGDESPDGLADHRVRLHADGCVLPGEHVPGFSHQCVSDVQDREVEFRGGGGNAEAVCACVTKAKEG